MPPVHVTECQPTISPASHRTALSNAPLSHPKADYDPLWDDQSHHKDFVAKLQSPDCRVDVVEVCRRLCLSAGTKLENPGTCDIHNVSGQTENWLTRALHITHRWLKNQRRRPSVRSPRNAQSRPSSQMYPWTDSGELDVIGMALLKLVKNSHVLIIDKGGGYWEFADDIRGV